MMPAMGPNVNVARSAGTSLKSNVRYGGKMVTGT